MPFGVTVPHWLEHERPLFVQYHGTATGARDLGVVICKPFGHEMMATHRALRHLAERLAEAGFATVRPDYDGTGDSSGTDIDPDRARNWHATIDHGVRSLHRRGVQRIALVGLRFGALVAVEYAKSRPVDALVLVAPPASGRAYLRELRALHAVRAGSLVDGGDATPADAEEVVGFLLRSDAAAYIDGASMAGPARLARRVLIVPRDDLPSKEGQLVRQLSAPGAQVTLSSARGYAGMGDGDPVKSVVPHAMWKEIVDWLAAEPAETVSPVSLRSWSRTAVVRPGDIDPPVLEEIVDIDGMMGILASPADAPRRMGPLVALQNVGANHHIGANRIYVELARRWAALGFSVLRYDLTGIGDTQARAGQRENDVYSDTSISDARRAVRWAMDLQGTDQVVLGGICSGAYVSFYAALREPRVRGVMLINPLTFRWREGDSLEVRARSTLKSTDYYRRAVLEADTWKRVARREVHVRAIARQIARRAWTRIVASTWPGSETDIRSGFRRICDRGAHVMVVCGEDDASRDVIAEHLGPEGGLFANENNFHFDIVHATDHTFSPQSARRDLARRLTAYLLASVPPRDSSPPSLTAGLRVLWSSVKP